MTINMALRAGVIGFVVMMLWQCHLPFTLALKQSYLLFELRSVVPPDAYRAALLFNAKTLGIVVITMALAIGVGMWMYERLRHM